MKVYIQTDIEGVAGFTSFEDRATPTLENYEHRLRMYRLLTGEVNAAVRAAKTSGADVIYVNDSHGAAYNIFFEELEEGCERVSVECVRQEDHGLLLVSEQSFRAETKTVGMTVILTPPD